MKTIKNCVLTLLCALFISVSSINAQNSFFPDKVGTEVEYVVKDAKGNILSYAKSTVTDVNKQDDKNYSITSKAEAFDKNKTAIGEPVSATTQIVDGAVSFDPKAMMGEAGADAEIEGTFFTFPSTLSVGQEFDYAYTLKMSGMSTKTTGKTKVTAKESVTTEAGTFDCYKVESETSTKVMMSTTKMKSTTWYAENVGAVKTETYDNKGKLQSLQELVSVKN